jgi:hypothetical protein
MSYQPDFQYLYDELREALGVSPDQMVTVEAVRENFDKNCTPKMVVAYIALAFQSYTNCYKEGKLTPEQAVALFKDGQAISNYIDRVLSQEHPMDKRFLLRYMEQAAMRYGHPEMTNVGYGHVVVYSRVPFVGDEYKTFDNSLYVPPLTGYWAIVKRNGR